MFDVLKLLNEWLIPDVKKESGVLVLCHAPSLQRSVVLEADEKTMISSKTRTVVELIELIALM
jgi:hypothetical protein